MILEKLAICSSSNSTSSSSGGRLFRSLMSLLYGVVERMTPREATAFYLESLSSISVALSRIINNDNNDNGNDDNDGNDNNDDDMIESSVDIYLSTVSLLTLQTGTVSDEITTALVTALVDVCSMLTTLGCDRRRNYFIARVVTSLQSLVPVSVMTDILVLHSDRTSTISTEGAKAIAEVVLPDYIAMEGHHHHHHHHHHLLAKVYSKRFMWQVFSSHLLGGVRVDQSGYMFITSLGHILHHHHHHDDRSRLTVSVMMSAIAEADMSGLYHFNDNDSPNLLIVTIVSALMSCADQGTRNEALVVIRFILLMHDERSLLSLLQKLVAVFDQVPSVAALFIDVVKDLVQHTSSSSEHYSYRLIYDNFISRVLLQVTSSPDDSEWISSHIDIVSASATLFHAVVLRLVRQKQQNEVTDNMMEVYDDVTTSALSVLKKLTEQTSDLRLQLLCFELDSVADVLATIKRR